MGMQGGLTGVRCETNPANVKDAIESLNRSFEEFKSDIDKEQKDFVTADKLDKINAHMSKMEDQLDELAKKNASAVFSGSSDGDLVDPEFQEDYKNYIRHGDNEQKLKQHARTGNVYNAASVGTDSKGGYTAPVEWNRKIEDALLDISPMRKVCRVESISKRGYQQVYNLHGTVSGWVGETDPRPATETSDLETVEYGVNEIYAMPIATQQILDDSEIDIADWLIEEGKLEFAKQEGDALLNGDGVKKPLGLLQYGSSSGHPLGDVKTINSGSTTTLTFDGITDLVFELPEEFEDKAKFILNKKTLGVVRKIKDTEGRPIWQPTQAAGEPSQINGFGYQRIKGMPNVGANNVPIAFGDFETAYTILDRLGLSILRDNLTVKGYVLFYMTKRVGGFMKRPDAMVYHQIAA